MLIVAFALFASRAPGAGENPSASNVPSGIGAPHHAKPRTYAETSFRALPCSLQTAKQWHWHSCKLHCPAFKKQLIQANPRLQWDGTSSAKESLDVVCERARGR